MIAMMDEFGCIKIVPETPVEAFALRKFIAGGSPCDWWERLTIDAQWPRSLTTPGFPGLKFD